MATRPEDIFSDLETTAPAPALPPVLPAPGPVPAAPLTSLMQEQSSIPPVRSAIDKLRPGSDLHSRTLAKLQAMLKFSHNKLSPNFSRFRNQELKVQAYLLSQDYKQLVDVVQNSKGAVIPQPIQVVVPYTYATLHAAATYIGTVLLGRKPLFPLAGIRGTNADSARFMETVLQSNLDASMGQERLWQHIWDGLLYGFSPIRLDWQERTGKSLKLSGGQRVFEDNIKFAGNTIVTVDPYKIRPDPRVPLHECHRRGDFIFDLVETSETALRDLEAAGTYKWVRQALALNRNSSRRREYEESRRMPAGQSPAELSPRDVVGFSEVCQGTVRLVPKDWGLGDETTSQLWRFTFLPHVQIIQAEQFDAIHEEHPYAISEPTTLGHDFISMSQSEMISVFQDLLSWLVSSRMENVRASISNSYVVDPARVEMNDMRASAIGRIIRLKQAAMGLPVGEAIMQLAVNDVTGGHFTDIQTIRLLADAATGVNDNLRGIQSAGGRRSATEARMSMQAGASRLSQLAMRISGQSFYTLANQMISNVQQWMPNQFWVETSGDEGGKSLQANIEQLVGSFNFQISDGSLPLDKSALVEQWKEILIAVARDPELRQQWDLGAIFRYTAELGGAKNIDSFKKQQPMIAPQGMDPAAAGGVPVPGRPGAPPLPASLAFSG